MSRGRRTTYPFNRRTAFTLIELLVVVGIIALVVGILIPTLGSVRDAARKTATMGLANDVATASTSFITDNRRAPGYFAQEVMGTSEAADVGFTNAENVLIDLAGGVVPSDGTNNPSATNSIVDVGPGSEEALRIDNALVGSGQGDTGGYLRLKDDVLYSVQGQVGDDPTNKDRTDMVDLVDYFGQPMLIFTPNDSAVLPTSKFASQFADNPANPQLDELSLYYWGANAGYLGAVRLGTRGANQARDSILGSSRVATELERSLEGLLGSPAYPGSRDPSDQFTLAPMRARGKVVVVSAGADRIYFAGRQDPGTESPGGAEVGKVIDYAPRPAADQAGDPRRNEVEAFDDLVMSGGE